MENTQSTILKESPISILQDSPTLNIGRMVTFPIKNIYGKFWIRQSQMLVGVTDLRARIGTYTDPWTMTISQGLPSNPLYKIPPFKFINDSLSDLLDARATELYNIAKNSSKNIVIMWSGGIDSTLVLTAFLKNIPQQEKNIIKVMLDTASILENLDFYIKHISNQFEIIHYQTFKLTKQFFKKNILIHGDPGDCLFGPSISKYQYFSAQGKQFEPWKNHLPKMKELLENPSILHKTYEPGFGNWYVNKITNNLEETGQAEHLTSIAEWWFWTYYNFKWEFSCQRPFFFFDRGNNDDVFEYEMQKEYAQNTFFNTDKFQQWAYTNIKRNVKDAKLHKREAKEYIYEFNKDEQFLENKIKIPGVPANQSTKRRASIPFCFTKNYQPLYYTHGLVQAVKILLEKYRG